MATDLSYFGKREELSFRRCVVVFFCLVSGQKTNTHSHVASMAVNINVS